MAMPFTKDGRLITACRLGNHERVKELLKEGASPRALSSNYSRDALSMAILFNRPKVISIFITDVLKFPDETQRGKEILDYSRKNDNLFLVKLLLTHGFKIDGDNPAMQSHFMHAAIRAGDQECLTLLLDQGIFINIKNLNSRETPLHCAVRHEKKSIVEFLLQRGADTTLTNEHGLTAYKIAYDPAIKVLFQEESDKTPPLPENKPSRECWELLSPDRIAHVINDNKIGQKITDSFNFATRERVMTIFDLENKTQSTVLKPFDEIKDKTPLEQAHDELKNQGGTAARETIYAAPRNKQRLDGAGG